MICLSHVACKFLNEFLYAFTLWMVEILQPAIV